MNDMTDSAASIVAEAAPTVKACAKCGVEKVLEEFHLDKKGGKFGRHCCCKGCRCAHVRDYRQRPGVKERQRAYQQRPEIKERQRAYEQRSEIKERRRIYRQRPEIKERRRVYVQRSEFKEGQRTYMRDRYRTDPAFKLKHNLRKRLRHALQGQAKSARTQELLGCTVEELRAHLEAQFKPGMTWENYGEWHIDHIRPCASFDLTDPEQQRACFHYTNLQPLWAQENIRKGAKFGLSPQAPDATVPPCSPPSSPHYGSNGDTDPGAICSTEPRGCS